MQQVREMSLSLRPPMLDDLGLLSALIWHFERYTSQTGIKVNFKHHGIERNFSPEVKMAAYRIVQEALTNVAKYAEVTEVNINVWANDQKLNFMVEDKGNGFDITKVPITSNGMKGMRERAFLLGGKFHCDSAIGVGTTIEVDLPLFGQTRD